MHCPKCRSTSLVYSEWVPMQQQCEFEDGKPGPVLQTGADSCPIAPALLCKSCQHEWRPRRATQEKITTALLGQSN